MSLMLEMIDDVEGFHQAEGLKVEMLDLIPERCACSDAEIAEEARGLFGEHHADAIASMPREERDGSLRRLYAQGASIRQLGRLTDIGRGAIQEAVKGF